MSARDELRAGEVWNSNSLIPWLLAPDGLVVESIAPPRRGHAPGWQAGWLGLPREAAQRRRSRC